MTTDWRESVRAAYSAAALAPEGKHPFPVGREFARSVGYPDEALERLPAGAVDAFAGVANVSVTAPLEEGMTVADVGCGAGLDSFLAAGRVGVAGRVVGFDFSAAMLARARRAGHARVSFVQAAAEQLPLRDASVDVVLVNGLFNLNPRREEIFPELARVLKPGGRLAGAELILRESLPDELRTGAANWFS